MRARGGRLFPLLHGAGGAVWECGSAGGGAVCVVGGGALRYGTVQVQ